MQKRIVKKASRLAMEIFKDIKKSSSKYSGFCSYQGICTRSSCEDCKYRIRRK